MDKRDAIDLALNYLKRVKANDIRISGAWLFGSFAKGEQNNNSDIDIAVILEKSEDNNFDTEVKLMAIRSGEETIIEPHPLSTEDFERRTPFVEQIISTGEKITV